MKSLTKEELIKVLKAATAFIGSHDLLWRFKETEDKLILEKTGTRAEYKWEGAYYDKTFLILKDEWNVEVKFEVVFAIDVEAFII